MPPRENDNAGRCRFTASVWRTNGARQTRQCVHALGHRGDHQIELPNGRQMTLVERKPARND